MPFPPLLNKVNSENSFTGGATPISDGIFAFHITFSARCRIRKGSPIRKVSGKFLLFLTLTRCNPTSLVLLIQAIPNVKCYQSCSFLEI